MTGTQTTRVTSARNEGNFMGRHGTRSIAIVRGSLFRDVGYETCAGRSGGSASLRRGVAQLGAQDSPAVEVPLRGAGRHALVTTDHRCGHRS